MQKHYLISSLIKQSNDVQPQQINNTPESNKKYIKTMIQFVKLF